MRDCIEVIDNVDDFEALGDVWADLGPQRFGPLVSHAWWSCAARAFALRLHVIVVKRAGRLAAVAPLCRVRRRGFDRLELLGARELFEPAQLPAVDAQALAVLCRAVAEQGMPLCLRRIEAGDACVTSFEQCGSVRVVPAPSTLFVPPGTPWLDFCGSLRNYKYRRRKLEAMGPVTFEVLSPALGELAPFLDELFRVENSGWKGRRGSALAQNHALGGFMRHFASRLAKRGELRMARLTCGGEPAALRLCAEQDRRFWGIKMGYDEKFAAGSPGFIGHVDLMQHALEARDCGFECLGRAEEWQRQWRMQERRYNAVYFYPNNPNGIVARLVDTAMSLGGALLRRVA
jgi:CelD/BcsL family acetyltransferase involved in cellulose biosynthesis